MTTTIDGIGGLQALAGQHLGYSEWHQITQAQVDLFAEATGDYQWIHVDQQRAAAGPFGTTIAHGYLTLSLAPVLLHEVYTVEGVALTLNYGLNKLRFPSPVPVGSRIRAGVTLDKVEEVSGGAQAAMAVAFEIEGAAKPACIAEIVFRYLA